MWMPITTFRKLYGARRSVTIQAEAAVHGRLRGRPGPGAGGHARAPPPRLRQARRLRGRDRPERHGPLAERHPRDLRRHHRGDRHQPAGGRDRGHEHHAGLGHRAHPRDRRAEGPGRAPARHPPAVPGGVGDPLRLRGRPRRARRRRLLHAPGHGPRQHHVRRLHGAGAAVGGARWPSSSPPRSGSWPGSTRRAAPPPSTPWSPCGTSDATPPSSAAIALRYPMLFAMWRGGGPGPSGHPRLQDARRSHHPRAWSWGS